MTGYSPRIECGLSAQAVAMRAKCGELPASDVSELREKAEQLLHRDDPMFRAIIAFATLFMEHVGDTDHLAWLGRQLTDDIAAAADLANPPLKNPWDERADLNG